MALDGTLFARLMCGSACTLLAVGLGAGAVSSQSAPAGDNIQLAPIVMKGKQGPDEATVLTTTTDRETIQKRMVQDFQDLGRRVDAGVNYNSTSKSINLRGLDQNRVLTTIDGIRVPWLADARGTQGGLDGFDFDGLSKMEITKGTDSSRYGSGALGGVIQLRTLDPADMIAEGRNWGALPRVPMTVPTGAGVPMPLPRPALTIRSFWCRAVTSKAMSGTRKATSAAMAPHERSQSGRL